MRSPVPAVALLLVFGGCKCNVQCGGGSEVDQTKANALVKSLADQVGNATSIECPADVAAKVGVTFECTATFAGGSRQTAVVAITSVDGSDIDATATWRTPLFGAKQRAAVEASITDKLGVKVSVHCKDDVVALAADQRLRCAVRGVEGEIPVDVWIGTDGDLGWKVNPEAPEAPSGGNAEPPPPAPLPEAPVEVPVEIPAVVPAVDPAHAPGN